MNKKRKQQLTKKLLDMNKKFNEKNLMAPTAIGNKNRNIANYDPNDFEDELSSFMGLSPRMLGNSAILPRIRQHSEQAPKMLENKMPIGMSKREFIQKLENNMGGKPAFQNDENSFENQYASNDVSRNNFYRSKVKNLKNIHDKFNTAIRVDSNWGINSKVAIDFGVNMKNKKGSDVNYRKIR